MPKQNYHHGDLKNALIHAGVEILSQEGAAQLTLRNVAARAGVSHSAPYAHFADKQALIAAISTQGYQRLYDRIQAVIQQHLGDPARLLIETAWTYVQFALNEPAYFKLMFSSVLERTRDYPALVAISEKSFASVVQIIEACQAAGILHPGPPDVIAVSVWSAVHGFTFLLIEGQISHTVLDRLALRDLLIFTLNQLTISDLHPGLYG
jgi:AcrR family transcriptional regulator